LLTCNNRVTYHTLIYAWRSTETFPKATPVLKSVMLPFSRQKSRKMKVKWGKNICACN